MSIRKSQTEHVTLALNWHRLIIVQYFFAVIFFLKLILTFYSMVCLKGDFFVVGNWKKPKPLEYVLVSVVKLNLFNSKTCIKVPPPLPPPTMLNWDHTVTALCDGPPQVAWRPLEILGRGFFHRTRSFT